MPDDERAEVTRQVRAKARRRVRNKLGFRWHALLYVLVNAALIAINRHYTPDTLWFVWPVSAWTAGLLLHAFATFQGDMMSQRMLEDEIERELARRASA